MARLLPASASVVRPLPSSDALDRLGNGDVAHVLQAQSGADCTPRPLSLEVLQSNTSRLVGIVVNDPDCGPTHAGDVVTFGRGNVYMIERAASPGMKVVARLAVATLLGLSLYALSTRIR